MDEGAKISDYLMIAIQSCAKSVLVETKVERVKLKSGELRMS